MKVDLHGLKPAVIMVVINMAYTGVNVIYKLATDDGMNFDVLIACRFVVASAFMIPFAFFIERRRRPKLTAMILGQGFLCGLFGGSLAQCMYVRSLSLTSTTFASATINLIPAFTFLLAVSLGLERLNLGDIGGKAKLVGTLLGISGAMVLTFYKGVEINLWSTHIDLLHGQPQRHVASSDLRRDHVLGCLMGLGSCISVSLWLITQAKMIEKYPCPYSSTALMSAMASIQTLIFALSTERDWKQWKLGWNIRLLAVAYLGIVASGIVVALTAWCVKLRGPLYVSVFNPLLLVLVAIVSSLFLNEKLHLGSVIGAVPIVLGLFIVLWGKGREMKNMILQPPPSDQNPNGDQPADSIQIVSEDPLTSAKNDSDSLDNED